MKYMKYYPQKYNALIILMVLSGLLYGAWSSVGVKWLATVDMNTAFFIVISTLLTLFIYIFPAVWVFKNPPKSVNKWVSLILILFWKNSGLVVYFVLVGIDYIQELKNGRTNQAPLRDDPLGES
jgi:hypothetical protein